MSESDTFKENGLGTKIKRYGKVSGTMAGLASKMAGEKFLGLKIEREEHAQHLLMALGNLKGPLMKVGQILATIPEALPPEYARAMQELQSNAPPMGWPFVRRRMKTELGADWESKFDRFDREACAAASLGQVHKAIANSNTLKTPIDSPLQKEPEAQNGRPCSPFIEEGTLLACKLQYPDMKSAIETDLNQLRIIFSLYERYDPSIKTKHIYTELAERLYEELDYEREANHCRLYEYMLRDEPRVHIPHVVPELSSPRLLTSTWLDGRRITDFKDESDEVRSELAMNMFRAWYIPLYHYGVIHGDPHPGNYTAREDLSINLLDFGCVRVFPPGFVRGVIDLYHALETGNKDLAVHSYETWGFKGLSNEQIDTLNIWASFLYGPILEDKTRVIGETNGAMYGKETAEKVHMKLRDLAKENGGVSVPREFVFMDRAALGLGSVFITLGAKLNWHRMFNELIADFDEKKLAEKQSQALKKFNLD
ncbi:MAG: AarF/ABC1/UbiB kinase family protein [Micavibrio sp.]|nr:AarF/ABC1/UbiB kinase family protein [Micavibrio sp.]